MAEKPKEGGNKCVAVQLQVLHERGTRSKKALNNVINYSLRNTKGNILFYGLGISILSNV